MSNLKLIVASKPPIVFINKTVNALRGEESDQIVPLLFQNGTGQIVTEGTILYEEGLENSQGFIRVTIKESFECNDNGQFDIKIETYPNIYEANKTINYTIDNSVGSISFIYNSNPEAKDFEIEFNNRNIYVFTALDFLTRIIAFDGDEIIAVALFGNVGGFIYNDIAYIEGTFISIDDITLGKLKYVAEDTDTAYEKIITYIAKDVNGNLSEPLPEIEE